MHRRASFDSATHVLECEDGMAGWVPLSNAETRRCTVSESVNEYDESGRSRVERAVS